MSESEPIIDEEHAVDEDLASRGRRLAAILIDTVIGGLIPTYLFVYFGVLDVTNPANNSPLLMLNLALTSLALYLLLNGYLLHHRGQSIGKRLLGIQIVSATTNKILPLYHVMLFRVLPVSAVVYIPIIGQYLPTVDALFIFRKDRRCVHDMICGSKVVNYATDNTVAHL